MSQEVSHEALPKLSLLPYSWAANAAHHKAFPAVAGVLGTACWIGLILLVQNVFNVQLGLEAPFFPQLVFFTAALVLLWGTGIGLLGVRHLMQKSAVPSSYLRQVQEIITRKHGVKVADEDVRLVLTLQAMDKHPFEDLVDGEILQFGVIHVPGDAESVPVQLVYEMDEKSYRLEKAT